MSNADIHFYFDPVCPFAWMTSKWVRMVQAQRGYTVDWRFISLRMINAAVDYDSHFPPGYEAGHTAGLKLLRVAARTRAEHGRAAVGRCTRLSARGSSTRPPTPISLTAGIGEPGPSSPLSSPAQACGPNWLTRSRTPPSMRKSAGRQTKRSP